MASAIRSTVPGTGVAAAGYGARGWEPFFEGQVDRDAERRSSRSSPSTGIAAIGMPVTALQNGLRPFVSFAGPPQTPAQGAFDLLGDLGTPSDLMFVPQPLTYRADLFAAAGLTPDPALVPHVLQYDDPPGDLFFSGTDPTAGVTDPAVDFRWSDGAVVAPVLDPAAIEAAYPCDGDQPAGSVHALCAGGARLAKGPYAMIQGGFDAAIPLDGDRMLVYGAAFDGDGRPATGLEPGTDFPNDTYQGTGPLVRSHVHAGPDDLDPRCHGQDPEGHLPRERDGHQRRAGHHRWPVDHLAHPHVRVPRPAAVAGG